MCPLSKVVDQLLGVLAPVQDRSVRSSALVHALIVEAASSRDELSDYFLHHPDAESAVLSMLPSVAPHGIPTPPTDAPSPESPDFKCQSEAPNAGGTTMRPSGPGVPATGKANNEPARVDASSQRSEKRGQKRKQASSTNSANAAKPPDKRYKVAEDAANEVLNDAFAPAALLQIRRNLDQKRRQTITSLDDIEKSIIDGLQKNSSDQELVDHLQSLQKLAQKATSEGDFSRFTRRFWGARYVKLFEKMKKMKRSKCRRSSLAVIFVDITMAQWVSDTELEHEEKIDAEIEAEIEAALRDGKKIEEVSPTERTVRVQSSLREAKRVRWKIEVAKHKFWLELTEAFGCAAMALIDKKMTDTQVSLLTVAKRQRLLSEIAEQYPTLKDDTKELSRLLEFVATFNVVPPSILRMETMSERALATTKKSLRELLDVVAETPQLPATGYNIIDDNPQWTSSQLGSWADVNSGDYPSTVLPTNYLSDESRFLEWEPMNELKQPNFQEAVDPALLNQAAFEGESVDSNSTRRSRTP